MIKITSITFAFLFVLGLSLGSPAQAEPGASKSAELFYTWTVQGSRHFTDDPDQIPAAYKDKAEQVSWKDLYAKTDKRFSVSEPVAVEIAEAFVAPEEIIIKEDIPCGAPYHNDIRYLQFGDITRMYTIVVDSCGKIRATLFGSTYVDIPLGD